MKWDDTGIAVCAFASSSSATWELSRSHTGSFYRAAVPKDVLAGQPDPSSWGEPVAVLDPSGCDPIANFVNHSIVFGEYSLAPVHIRTIG